MADPILPNIYRASWVWQHPSGESEDRFVNNFFFEDTGANGSIDVVAPLVGQRLYEFYTTPDPSAGALINFMPAAKVSAAECRVYHLGDAPPRTPFTLTVDPLPNLAATGGLPAEAAVCLSFYSHAGPRGRGRIFFGPLTTSALKQVDGATRVADNVVNALVAAATAMEGTADGIMWSVLSRMDASSAGVIGGWVDNAFDTQRRRGLDPDLRTTWGQALGGGEATLPFT